MTDVPVALRYRLATYYDASLPGDITDPGPPVPPAIDSIDPASIVGDGTPQEVIVTGSGFKSSSVVWADEAAQATTHVSGVTLTYQAQADQAGTQTITVHNGSEVSNSVELTVTAGAARAAAPEPEPDPAPEVEAQAETPLADDPPPRRRRQT